MAPRWLFVSSVKAWWEILVYLRQHLGVDYSVVLVVVVFQVDAHVAGPSISLVA